MKQFTNVVRYVIIVVVDIAIMVLFQSYLNFLLLIGLIFFLVYSLYGVYRVKNNFNFQLVAPLESMERGSEFYIRMILNNPTWFPLLNATVQLEVENAFYREVGVHSLNFPVRARKSTEVEYPIVMDYCGRLCVSAKYIRFTDLLGICNIKVELQESTQCLVVPLALSRDKESGRLYHNAVSDAAESKEKGYDFSEISGIREYIPGDKLQNIHWKLSVKKDELMVKERVSVSATQVQILVELANDEQMRADAVLELTDGITKAFVLQNLPFTIHYYSVNTNELKSCYIGNEIERKQWMETLLHDHSYRELGLAEHLFLQQYGGAGSYLYIGLATGSELSEDVMYGDKDTVAVIRSC